VPTNYDRTTLASLDVTIWRELLAGVVLNGQGDAYGTTDEARARRIRVTSFMLHHHIY
jgi:hypothetical protein